MRFRTKNVIRDIKYSLKLLILGRETIYNEVLENAKNVTIPKNGNNKVEQLNIAKPENANINQSINSDSDCEHLTYKIYGYGDYVNPEDFAGPSRKCFKRGI